MKLRMQFSDNKLNIYREKWGVILFSGASGLGCLAFSLMFYRMSESQTDFPHVFTTLFSILFGLVGATVLWRIPQEAKIYFQNNGAHICVADVNGITLTPAIGAAPKHFHWSSVCEIALAERFRVVESSETSFSRRVLILFLSQEASALLDSQRGLGDFVWTSSGEGRLYFLGDYPKSCQLQIGSALRAIAPSTVDVRLYHKVTFNRNRNKDCYEYEKA